MSCGDILDVISQGKNVYVIEDLVGPYVNISRTSAGIRISAYGTDLEIDEGRLEFGFYKITPTFNDDFFIMGIVQNKQLYVHFMEMIVNKRILRLDYPTVAFTCKMLGLKSAPYKEIVATAEGLRTERDAPSTLGLMKKGIIVRSVAPAIQGLFENSEKTTNTLFLRSSESYLSELTQLSEELGGYDEIKT